MTVEEEVLEVRHLGHSIHQKMRERTKGETTSQRKHFEMWHGIEGIEEFGIGGDVGRIHVAIDDDTKPSQPCEGCGGPRWENVA
jgi:hypothetical protein